MLGITNFKSQECFTKNHRLFIHNENYIICNTVYIQIFEGCKFRGRPKSRIFAILFSWISCYHTLYFKCITTVLYNFEDLNFVDDKLTVKTAKFTYTSLENLYAYGI